MQRIDIRVARDLTSRRWIVSVDSKLDGQRRIDLEGCFDKLAMVLPATCQAGNHSHNKPLAGDKWSFARLDEAGRVLETAEKKRISNWATTGLYYFSHGRDFVRNADRMIAENDRVNREFYVAPLYNRMIQAGGTVLANKVAETWVLGTPEDLNHFLREYPQQAAT